MHPLVKMWQRSEARLAVKRVEWDKAKQSGLPLCVRCGRIMTNAKCSGLCGKCSLELMGDDD